MNNSISTLTNSNQQTMSSREVAELTGKQHWHVKRDIKHMCEQLEIGASKFGHTYRDSQNKAQTEYLLPKDECLTLISGYNVKLRHAIVTRWQQLEITQHAVAHLPDFSNPAEAARAWASEYEQKNQYQLEAKRLNQLCNTITRQFASGQTAPKFCMQLNGVNTQAINTYLVNCGAIIKEQRGHRPSAQTRDKYFKLHTFEGFDGKPSHQPQLTKKGAKWLYKKYLNGDLPMKKSWDRKLTHLVFDESEVAA